MTIDHRAVAERIARALEAIATKAKHEPDCGQVVGAYEEGCRCGAETNAQAAAVLAAWQDSQCGHNDFARPECCEEHEMAFVEALERSAEGGKV